MNLNVIVFVFWFTMFYVVCVVFASLISCLFCLLGVDLFDFSVWFGDCCFLVGAYPVPCICCFVLAVLVVCWRCFYVYCLVYGFCYCLFLVIVV